MDDADIKHRYGIPWWQYPPPPIEHECRPQTSGWVGLLQVVRCACGARLTSRQRTWLDRNTRRPAA